MMSGMDSETIHRFIIIEVMKKLDLAQIRLKLKRKKSGTNELNEEYFNCILTGVWFESQLRDGQIVHIIDTPLDPVTKTYTINNLQGLMVIEPHLLISSTTLMSAHFCMRKAWLAERFRGWGQGNKAMLVGDIVHQLFQKSCQERLKGTKQLQDAALSLLQNNDILHQCFSIDIQYEDIMNQVFLYIPHIASWMDSYLHSKSSLNSDKNRNKLMKATHEDQLQVIKVVDIEDNIWNTDLALKGKVDVTLEVAIHENNSTSKKTVPLELKTGRASFSLEHEGQVLLYSMMMEKRNDVNEGLLLYLKDGPQMSRIFTKPALKRDLIVLRNELATHLTQFEAGPKPIGVERICSKCDHLLDCALTLQTMDPHNLASSDVMSNHLVPQVLAGLTNSHLDFFKKWITLLHMENAAMIERDSSAKQGFWNESSESRESNGFGLAKLSLKSQSMDGTAVFVRSSQFISSHGELNAESMLRTWERVAVSIDSCHPTTKSNLFAIGFGFIKRLEKHFIELILEKRLDSTHKHSIFRIDHLSSNGLLSTNFTNLLRLMDPTDAHSTQLRSIIIDQKPVSHQNKLTKKIVTKGKYILKQLNEPQQRAVLKALSTDSYILLRGMPGAGKTQTIVSLVRLLMELDHTVLITSYTHSAVDNILLKLKSHGVNFLRIGSESRIHPDLLEYSASRKTKNIKTLEELNSFYASVRIVASTCLGVSNHPIFHKKSFDFCIVDEASQVLLPTCLGPLFYADRFMLVGDPKQLPPVVQCQAAQVLGLDQSLFLILQNDKNTTDLTIQYRMNKEIMRLCNELTYDHVLKCGSTAIENSTLISANFSYINESQWIAEALHTELSKSVIFLNTDKISAEEIKDQKGKVCNKTEAIIVKHIITSFIKHFKLSTNQLGIISPYQRQVQLLRQLICIQDLEINTVDQYQGRDKDIIIFSCVRNNAEKDIIKGEILEDERRLNVAISRAKKKLIIIGSKSTLVKYKPFYKLISILRFDQIVLISKLNNEF